MFVLDSPRTIVPQPEMPERIGVIAHPSSDEASRAVAREIAELIRARDARGQSTVLGLATGSTPTGVYAELVRLHQDEGLSFANVTTFNLDEYWPMAPTALQSYRRFMDEHLFSLVDIDPSRAHLPDGLVEREEIEHHCRAYEQAIADAGGIDLQLLGIGRTGHIGFNEPGSAIDGRTRLIDLDRITRMDAASDFFGERNVPRQALTMGVGTILGARRIVLMAFGEHKADVVRRAVEEGESAAVAASALQRHASATFVLDPAAAGALTRFATPWRLGSIRRLGLEWDDALVRRAVIDCSLRVGKAILKLTAEDYSEHGLQELLTDRGGAYAINLDVFRALQRTITGWPAGRPQDDRVARRAVDAAGRTPAGAAAARLLDHILDHDPFPKRILVFSPHPDDDVISMGGTLMRLCEQGHEVHVAYQTSGNIAVWDEAALRHVDFVREFSEAFPRLGEQSADRPIERMERDIEAFLAAKSPGEPDIPPVRMVKTLIRRTEARAAARDSGVDPSRVHFLDLPFYETGQVRKAPLTDADLELVQRLLVRIRPHQVYAAGDLSDPHGTHRVCLRAVLDALTRLAASPEQDWDWRRSCEIWLYRGAWQEWSPAEIEMAVPLSPEELLRKRRAIFRHESQKDTALFPGPNDPREFWQRAEDRNRETARLYDRLGLAEYEALEGFVRHRW